MNQPTARQNPAISKTNWPEGEWADEPDDARWQDPTTGLHCIVLRNVSLGHLCGYVAVPPTHPLHGKSYDDVDWELHDASHGGLTFANGCQADKEWGVCHTPPDGEPDNVWWFGFDCAHAGDLSPGMVSALRHLERNDTYKTFDYVYERTTELAKALGATQ